MGAAGGRPPVPVVSGIVCRGRGWRGRQWNRRCGLVLVPEVGSQQIEVAGVAELALVVDYQNQLIGEAHHVDSAAIE
jgi:hypothetical protein